MNAEIKTKSAFSRIDLVVVVGVIISLSAWFGFGRFGERGRIVHCAKNLKVLGETLQSYANDHAGGIPAAAINFGNKKISWDENLFPYLKPGLSKSNGAYEKRQLMLAVQSLFFCPSDPVPRNGFPRSYAMPGNNMSSENWPPGPNSKTGVGLGWNKGSATLLLGEAMAEKAMKDPDQLPKLKLSALPAPADTLLLTESFARENMIGSVNYTQVWRANSQFTNSQSIHFGKFNYLMADGRVELFTGLQTGGIGTDPAGIWTIKSGD